MRKSENREGVRVCDREDEAKSTRTMVKQKGEFESSDKQGNCAKVKGIYHLWHEYAPIERGKLEMFKHLYLELIGMDFTQVSNNKISLYQNWNIF